MRLTQEVVRELLEYEPDTGEGYWRHRDIKWFEDGKRPANAMAIWNNRYGGKKAFTHTDRYGYKTGRLLNKVVRAHRIFFLHYHGYLPTLVEHRNGDRQDNNIDNLKDATYSENNRNRQCHRDKGEFIEYWDERYV